MARNEARPIPFTLLLFSGRMPTITMVTILNVYWYSFLYGVHQFIESSCRLQQLAAFEIVFLSRDRIVPLSHLSCQTSGWQERVPNHDSVHLVTSQLSRFKVVHIVVQHIGFKRRLM